MDDLTAHSAIILGIETIDTQPKITNYKKEVYLLTDGESKSDWGSWDEVATRYNEKKVGLHVMCVGSASFNRARY